MGVNHRANADFHTLTRRLVLRGTLTTRTGLRIGSGGGGLTDAVDLPVLRDAEGAPFIPGGSLKGALRSTIESLVRGAGVPGLRSCDPLIEKKGESCGYTPSGARKDATDQDHCIVCQLFGSRILASHVRISDAMLKRTPEERAIRQVPVEMRDGVAIDRDLKRVFENRKYDFEVVSAGATFDLEIYVENPIDWQLGLLVVGLDQLRDGFTALGGFTSRGLGRVELSYRRLEQVTATGLLKNLPPEVTEGDQAVGGALQKYREALAAKVARLSREGGV